MERGVKELDCFMDIRKQLFNDDFSSYGMSKDDRIQVKDLFFKATPNSKPSEFPDFISDEGFIEHFEITSSDVSKAGAEYKKTMSAFDKEHKAKEEELTTYISKNQNEIHSVVSTISNGIHSHANLMLSLKKSLEHHINSANKYTGNSKCRIYMIEYNELGLIMKIVEQNLPLRDLPHCKVNIEYQISSDKIALNYLYEHEKDIDYIIFSTEFYTEIIKIANIPEIIKEIPFSYDICPTYLTNASFSQGVSFSHNVEKEGIKNT